MLSWKKTIDNRGCSAKQLLKLLDKRFDKSSNNQVVQAKMAAFNAMELSSSQSVGSFIDSLIRARRELHSLGAEHISLEGDCRTILLNSLVKDDRYRDLGNAFRAAAGTTWDHICLELEAEELSRGPTRKNKKQDEVALPSLAGLSNNQVRKLNAFVKNNFKGNSNKGKQKFKGTCFNCNKTGHKAADCTAEKKTTDKKKIKCSYCNIPYHTADQCRKRKKDQDPNDPGSDPSDQVTKKAKVVPTVDDIVEALLATNKMIRSVATDDPKPTGEPVLTLDSGATAHMVPEEAAELVDDTSLNDHCQNVATAKSGVYFKTIGKGRLGSLSNTLITETGVLEEGVASIPQFDIDGYYVLCGGGRSVVLDKNLNELASAPLINMAYKYQLSDLTSLPANHKALLGSAQPKESLTLWHKRLGHHNRRNLSQGISQGKIKGPSAATTKNTLSSLCEPCVKAKATRHSYDRAQPSKMKETSTLLPKSKQIRRVSTDLKGPVSVAGKNGEKYLQLYTEDDTKWRTAKTMKNKSEAIGNTESYLQELKSEGQQLVELHSDGALELISKNMKLLLTNNNTRLTYSPPYTPELNGIAERANRSVWESSDAMLNDCVLPLMFWTYSVLYAVLCLNFLPTNTAFGWMTPYEAKYGTIPDVSEFRIFGCVAYVHIPDAQRTSTFADKAYKGYYLGPEWPYLDRHLVFIPALDKIIPSAHVLFDEVTKQPRADNELLVIDPEKRKVEDFRYLEDIAYVDDTESDILYVTTRVTVYNGYIVAFRAPVVNGRRGQEESHPTHARDVEEILKHYWTTQVPMIWDGNQLTLLCDVYRGAPVERADGADHPVVPADDQLKPACAPKTTTPRRVGAVDEATTDGVVGVPALYPSAGAKPVAPIATDVSDTTGTPVQIHSGRPRRENVQRRPLNISQLGDVTERTAYLCASDLEVLTPEGDDRHSRWHEAKVAEMASQVLENDTFYVTPLPADRKAIGSRWVVKEKPDKLKARFTPKGYAQKQDLDYKETWAPVAKLVTLRVFLTLVAILCLHTCQLDIKTAFLNAVVEEEIYVQPLYDMCDILRSLLKKTLDATQKVKIAKLIRQLDSGGVLRLKKAIYGLKQAPREWWKTLHSFLLELGFKPNKADTCFYVLHLSENVFVLLLLYVDDILLAATSAALVSVFAAKISKRFRVSSEGPLRNYLGFDIKVDPEKKQVRLSMSKYVERMFKRFKCAIRASVVTPLSEHLSAALVNAEPADSQFITDFEYREKIGCILYYMICLRPNICFSVGFLARYTNQISKVAASGVTQLLQYCYNTRFEELVLGGTSAYITAYSDSDWAGDRLSRKSVSSYILYLGSGPIDWKSTLQRLTAQSSAEAEYIAKNLAVRAVLWLRTLLKETGISTIITKYSSSLFGDSLSAGAMAMNPITSDRTKHVAIKYHLTRDVVEGGVLVQEHVETSLNVADIGTKILGKRAFLALSDLSMGRGEIQRPTKRVKTVVTDEFA